MRESALQTCAVDLVQNLCRQAVKYNVWLCICRYLAVTLMDPHGRATSNLAEPSQGKAPSWQNETNVRDTSNSSSAHCALTPVCLMMAPHLASSLAISAA
jgi:hypothetical protein